MARPATLERSATGRYCCYCFPRSPAVKVREIEPVKRRHPYAKSSSHASFMFIRNSGSQEIGCGLEAGTMCASGTGRKVQAGGGGRGGPASNLRLFLRCRRLSGLRSGVGGESDNPGGILLISLHEVSAGQAARGLTVRRRAKISGLIRAESPLP